MSRASRPPSGTGSGRLLVVATPLGNLGDITARALEALRGAALVACEDTRRTRKLLNHYGIKVPTLSCHRFSEVSRIGKILAALREGGDVALLTDAGTPGVSDPGSRLVRAASEEGIPVEPIPGPSAPAAALSVAGMEASGFLFAGYPPARRGARKRFLGALAEGERARILADPSTRDWPLVLFEAPHRIRACLEDLAGILGDREAVLLREMTKVHEQVLRGPLSRLREAFLEKEPRGEFTIVVEAGEPVPALDAGAEDLGESWKRLLESGLDRKKALRRLARETGRSRRELYRLLVAGPEEE